MNRMLAFRPWHGALSILVAASLGAATNLATGEFSWGLTAACVGLVLVQLALSRSQSVKDRSDRRAARDALLGRLRPVPPGERSIQLLTALFSPTPLWGRAAELDSLVKWCVERSTSAKTVRVLTGPAGVGKSRLALALAEGLPPEWASGRFLTTADVIERIVAAGDPTLVIVDDAEQVSTLDILIEQAMRHPDKVRLLLVTRTMENLPVSSNSVLAQLDAAIRLAPIGEPEELTKWYWQAVRAYARLLNVPPPALTVPRIDDDRSLLVLHARALLATLGRTGADRWSLPELTKELLDLEKRSWRNASPAPPVDHDIETIIETVAVLTLFPAKTTTAAANLLRLVPQLAPDSAHEARLAMARWARHRYPLNAGNRLGFAPHLVAEYLIITALASDPPLQENWPVDHVPAAVVTLAHACVEFSSAIGLLRKILERYPAALVDSLIEIVDSRVLSDELDRLLASLAETAHPEQHEHLSVIEVPSDFPHLGVTVAKHEVAVARVREHPGDGFHSILADALDRLGTRLSDIGQYEQEVAVRSEEVELRQTVTSHEREHADRPLSRSLNRLGWALANLGRHQEAMEAYHEGISIERDACEPEADCGLLSGLLNQLGLSLWQVGRYQEAAAAYEESIALGRDREPDSELAVSINNLGLIRWELGDIRGALYAYEEALDLEQGFIASDPDHQRDRYASFLSNKSTALAELNRKEEALATDLSALSLWREITEQKPQSNRPALAQSLSNVGGSLHALSRHREAVELFAESLTIRRALAADRPEKHLPSLAESLNNIGATLLADEENALALAAHEEAVTIQRQLADDEPARHRAMLAEYLANLGLTLWRSERPLEALTNYQEALTIQRELAQSERFRHLPRLAAILEDLANLHLDLDQPEKAVDCRRESMKFWKACFTMDPDLHGAGYRRILQALGEDPVATMERLRK